MAGYYGYSMSNNAVQAYEDGQKPLSKWKKQDILSAIQDLDIDLNCDLATLQKAPLKVLKDLCLHYASWHHTGSYYNETDFYSIDEEKIAELTDEEIEEAIKESRQPKDKPKEERWKCAYFEWYGSRNYRTHTEYIEIGTVKGDWFYLDSGRRKSINANGFRFIEKIEPTD